LCGIASRPSAKTGGLWGANQFRGRRRKKKKAGSTGINISVFEWRKGEGGSKKGPLPLGAAPQKPEEKNAHSRCQKEKKENGYKFLSRPAGPAAEEGRKGMCSTNDQRFSGGPYESLFLLES